MTVGANVTTYSATGLSSDTTYYYRVRATNAFGDSANTSTASATTPAAGVPVAVAVPDGDFTDAAGYCINSNTGGGLTFTSPMTATLSGWNISAIPSTANGGYYARRGSRTAWSTMSPAAAAPALTNERAVWSAISPPPTITLSSITPENCITTAAWWAAPNRAQA